MASIMKLKLGKLTLFKLLSKEHCFLHVLNFYVWIFLKQFFLFAIILTRALTGGHIAPFRKFFHR